ncbi:MAG: sterol desaturase family protein [Sandaracinaceae bacterium]
MATRITDACVKAARGPWRARRGPNAARRVVLFDDFVVEKLIFRGHPAAPFVVLVPVCAWLVEAAPHRDGQLAPWLGVFALGAVAWTLLEYLMHRFLFHLPTSGDAGRVFTFILHGHHHVTPAETSRLAATPVQFGSLFAAVYGVSMAAAGAWGALFTAGMIVGYLAYEAVHHTAHHGRPKGRVMRWLVRHHLAHHYESPDRRWGISSPLWDWVFRTR